MSTRFVSGLYSRCAVKTRYATRAEARAGLERVRGREGYRGGPIEVYHCDRCEGYHIGNAHPTIRDRRG